MRTLLSMVVVLALVSIVPGTQSFAADTGNDSAASFNIKQFVIAGSVDNREPVGIVDVFSSSTEKVYCFLEATSITEDTPVSFVWYHEDAEVATVELSLREGGRWRTFSSKKLGGRQGNWKVELQDASGSVLETVTFTVE